MTRSACEGPCHAATVAHRPSAIRHLPSAICQGGPPWPKNIIITTDKTNSSIHKAAPLNGTRHGAGRDRALPGPLIAIGPPIKDGFYYDFDLGSDPDGGLKTFAPEDLEAIEKRMRQIVSGRHPFVRSEVSADEAKRIFADQTLQDRPDRRAGEGRRGRVRRVDGRNRR